MEKVKKVKTRRVFDEDFKAEIVKIRIAAQLNPGKNVPELSKSFNIAKIFFIVGKPTRIWRNRQKLPSNKVHICYKLIAKNEKLRKDVSRLQDEKDILKKVSAGVPVTFLRKSD